MFKGAMAVSIAEKAHIIRRDAHAVWLAIRDRRTPWYARIWGWLIAAYALSPIDLIPDFVPFIGMIDDLLILPLGIWVFVKLVPADLFAEFRQAAEIASQRPKSRGGAVLIVTIWLLLLSLIAFYIWSWRFW